jgi:succinoglycan biosynthesis transport protein ExoP
MEPQKPSQQYASQPYSTQQYDSLGTQPMTAGPGTGALYTTAFGQQTETWKPSLEGVPTQFPQTIGEVWAMCLRYRRWAIGVGVAMLCLVVLSGVRTTPLYQSEASLELFTPPKTVSYQEAGSDEPTGFFDISRINTQRERLLSTPVLERTLATCDLGVTPAYRQAKDPVEVLRDRLTVTVNKDNYVFDVALVDEDRLRAQRGLDAVLAAFFAEQNDRAGTRANSSLAFLSNKVESARHAVDAARAEEQEFKREHNILSTDPEENLHSRTLRELTTKHSDLEQRRAASAALVIEIGEAMNLPAGDARREALLRIDPIGGTNQLVQQSHEQLFQAEAEAEKLAPRYGPKHPRMQEAQLAIQSRVKELDLAIDTAKDDILVTDQQLLQEEAALDKLIAKEGKALDGYRADLNRLQALTQATKSASDILDDLMKRQGEEDVVKGLDAKQVIIDNKPGPATGPINLHLFRLLAIGLFLGGLSGLGAAFACELLERNLVGVVRARELTGLPLLGMIPSLPGLAPLAGADPEITPEIAAAFRGLRENLILTSQRLETGRCLMVTSPSPAEGKTSVTARLAVAFASAGARVLLVDADMRRPAQPEEMGVVTELGLSAVLSGSDQAAPIATPYANLDYLPVGAAPTNPAELLYSPQLAHWLMEARNHYDLILCDSPPLLVTDPLILGEQCDGIILVVRDRYTLKSALHEAMISLQPIRERVIGFVFNDAQEERARNRYYYYYGDRNSPTAAVAAAQSGTQATSS